MRQFCPALETHRLAPPRSARHSTSQRSGGVGREVVIVRLNNLG
jgi:hypothetical protein